MARVIDITAGDLGHIGRLAEAWNDQDLSVRLMYETAGVSGGERFELRGGRQALARPAASECAPAPPQPS